MREMEEKPHISCGKASATGGEPQVPPPYLRRGHGAGGKLISRDGFSRLLNAFIPEGRDCLGREVTVGCSSFCVHGSEEILWEAVTYLINA